MRRREFIAIAKVAVSLMTFSPLPLAEHSQSCLLQLQKESREHVEQEKLLIEIKQQK